MRFVYTAINKDGKTIHGFTEAANKEAVSSSLSRQGIHVLIVKPEKEKSSFLARLRGGNRVRTKDLVVFTRQLSTMVSAGVPLTRSLSTLQSQTDNKYFHHVIGSISKEVEGGIPLADAFAKFPRVFSNVYINMVRAGEAGGILDDILKRLATQVEQEASMKKKIKSAMAYPLVILTITVIAFFGIMLFIIPKLSKIMKDLGGENATLPIYTRAMLGVSDFIQQNILLILVVIIISSFLIRRYIRTKKGRYQFDKLLLRLPVLKLVVVKVAIARFARTFASLMAAGVGVLDALDVTGAAVGNKVIEAELKEAAKGVKNGKQLSEMLSASPNFPPIVSQMLAVGEETGQIDTILVKVADFYEEEVSAVIDGLSALIEPLMIVVLGALVGLIAASVMGPIANLSKNIGNN